MRKIEFKHAQCMNLIIVFSEPIDKPDDHIFTIEKNQSWSTQVKYN